MRPAPVMPTPPRSRPHWRSKAELQRPASLCDLTLLQVDRNVSASVLGAAAMGFKARRIVLPALHAKVHVTADAAALPEATSEPCRSV